MRFFAAFLLLTGCGYHFEGGGTHGELTTISIPYIKGQGLGQLNTELAQALSASGVFDYVHDGGELILQVAIIADGDDRIGFRFDRNPTSGKLRDNLVGTENRRSMTAHVTLVNGHTQETIFGPEVVNATADYDYVDSNSIRDLTFTTPSGKHQKVLDFSLGQLDSFEGAHDDTGVVLYRILAQKIVDGLIMKQAIERTSRKA